MAFIPVPDVVMVETLYELGGQQIENTLYFDFQSVPDEADINALLLSVNAWVVGEIMPLLSGDISFRGSRGTLLTLPTSIQVENPEVPPVVGSDVTEALPGGSAYVVQFKTSLRGRSFRGRNYIAGIPRSAQLNVNTIVPSWRNDITLAYFELLDPLVIPAPWVWVVVSRYSGTDPVTGDPIPREVGFTSIVTSVATADEDIDSQRRRLRGRGS